MVSSYVKYYWHGTCKGKSFPVMSTFFGTPFARERTFQLCQVKLARFLQCQKMSAWAMRTIIVLDRIWTKNDLDKLCDNQKVLELKGVLFCCRLLTIGSPPYRAFLAWILHHIPQVLHKVFTSDKQGSNKTFIKSSPPFFKPISLSAFGLF